MALFSKGLTTASLTTALLRESTSMQQDLLCVPCGFLLAERTEVGQVMLKNGMNQSHLVS